MKMIKTVIFVGLFLISGFAGATALSSYTFKDKAEEQEFRELTAKIRCLVCQNQSLADSDAELANDLRREVYALWNEQKSEDEIVDFLVSRYGDFVLYDPPFKPSTYILWFGPFILLIIGAYVLSRALKTKAEDEEAELTEEEQQRLKALLGDNNDNQEPTR